MSKTERQIVATYLKDNKLIKIYADALGQSVRVLYEYFNREGDLKPKDWSSLYCFLGLLPEDMGIDKSLPFRFDLTNRSSDNNSFFSYDIWSPTNDRNFISFTKEYYSRISSTITSGKNEILAYQYLANKQFVTDHEYQRYFAGHNTYLEKLEDHILNQIKLDASFKYNCIIAPSQGTFDIFNPKSDIENISILLPYLPNNTFKHCCKMLTMETHKNVEFYLLTQPRRLSSIFLIDQKKMLSEEYRIRHDGIAHPDILFEYDKMASKSAAELIQMHYDDFQKIISDAYRTYCIRITTESLTKAFESYNDFESHESNEILRHIESKRIIFKDYY